jgi:GNAT superfamily N-acetyltransferase
VRETVRPAGAHDVGVLASLLEQARSDVAELRGGALLLAGPVGATDPLRPGEAGPGETPTPSATAAQMVSAWLDASDTVLLCGCIDDVVVGLAAGRRIGAGASPLGVVECCYVEPEARQVGIGGALAGALVAWFQQQGCAGVDVPALPGDRSTKQLWESAGFSARLLVLHRPLG